MRIDLDHSDALVTDEPAPGCYGDSCANTSRFLLLESLTGNFRPDLAAFRTELGYLRHPESPWREDDMTSDQCFPLLAGLIVSNPQLAEEAKLRLRNKTGNGDLSSPSLMALCRDLHLTLALLNALAAILFKLPYRWSDSKRKLEKIDNDQNAGDYLNWFATVNFLHLAGYHKCARIARLGVSKETVSKKIHFYFRNEPNVDWVLNAYDAAIDIIYP